MFEAEYSHEGDRCTFETLLKQAGLRDRALRAIGEIVHDIDCKDEVRADEAPGLPQSSGGWSGLPPKTGPGSGGVRPHSTISMHRSG